MLRSILTLCLVSFAFGSATADVVHLRKGGTVAGSVEKFTREKKTFLVVTLDDGIKVMLAEGDVARVDRVLDPTKQENPLAEYQRLLAATPDNAEAHWELARWCRSKILLPQRDRHVRHVIRLDPEHSIARQALGYTKENGEWILNDELQRSRGLVHHQGKWKTPADIEMVEAADKQEVEEKTWLKKIKALRGRAMKSGKTGQEALAELASVRDPVASIAVSQVFIEQLKSESKYNAAEMDLWLRLLSQWETPAAADALIFGSLFASDSVIRERCLDRLEDFAKERAVNTYIAMLGNNDNKKVRIAGHALGAMKDPRSILPLIDALVTEHKFKSGGGPAMTSTFDRNGGGGGGLNFGGGKEKIIEKQIQNAPVLSALMALAPDVNYQYDEARWRDYFSRQYAEVNFRLNRDP